MRGNNTIYTMYDGPDGHKHISVCDVFTVAAFQEIMSVSAKHIKAIHGQYRKATTPQQKAAMTRKLHDYLANMLTDDVTADAMLRDITDCIENRQLLSDFFDPPEGDDDE